MRIELSEPNVEAIAGVVNSLGVSHNAVVNIIVQAVSSTLTAKEISQFVYCCVMKSVNEESAKRIFEKKIGNDNGTS